VSALACDAQAAEEEAREAQQEESQQQGQKLESPPEEQPPAPPTQPENPEPQQAKLRVDLAASPVRTRTPSAPGRHIGPGKPPVSYVTGLGLGYSSHQGPSGALNLDAFFGMRRLFLDASARASVWHFRSEATKDGRRARFRGYGLRVDACPFALEDLRWRLEPCVGVDAGVLAASGALGAELGQPHSSLKIIADVVLMARVASTVSGWLLLELQGELALALVTHRYGFGDPPSGPDIFDMPRLGGGILGSAGIHFR
jgi:hypothetical protein